MGTNERINITIMTGKLIMLALVVCALVIGLALAKIAKQYKTVEYTNIDSSLYYKGYTDGNRDGLQYCNELHKKTYNNQ
jgi:ABC-type arginine transport system permease subunit